jgi:Transposase DDE domain group 1
MDRAIDLLVWFYSQRAGAENLIKEANNDAGLAAHPSRRWATNCVHFQLVMLAYNLNCWLLLFQREEGVVVDNLEHTRLATARLRFLSWPPRSGSTPGGWASATAINMRSADCSSA